MFNEKFLLNEFKQKLDKIVEYVKSEIVNLRGGRISPSLVENIIVETYQGQTKLKLQELASIRLEGSSALLISPFDQTTIKDIEKALLSSQLNLMPRVDGRDIHLKFPPLSEEQRQKLVKVVSQSIEEGKERIRSVRDETRRKIKTAFENSEISEDQKFKIEKEVDKFSQQVTLRMSEMQEKKKQEIMEI